DQQHHRNQRHENAQRLVIDNAQDGNASHAGDEPSINFLDVQSSGSSELSALPVADIAAELQVRPFLHLLELHAGLAPTHQVQEVEAPRTKKRLPQLDLRLHRQGQPHIGRELVERYAVKPG